MGALATLLKIRRKILLQWTSLFQTGGESAEARNEKSEVRFVPSRNYLNWSLPGRFYFLFLIALSTFLTNGCAFSPGHNPSEPRWSQKYLIGAYYYLWYPGNWREGYINGRLFPQQLPALGQYDSSDIKTIEQHIAWCSQYGIDFWAISWWPGHPELDQVLREKVLKAKNIHDLKFCIFYETSALGLKDDRIDFTPDQSDKLVADFKFLAQNYFSHPSYLKIQGRPVAIIYLTRTFIGDYPKAIGTLRKKLQELGFNLFLIGDEIFWYVMRPRPLPPSTNPEIKRIKLFDGITAYNLYNWAKTGQMGYGNQSTFLSEVRKLYLNYQRAVGKKGHLIPAIIPGYNDRGVRLSENHPVIPRQYQEGGEEGSFFSQALRQTVIPFLDSDRPLALITSFNEWNEGTQIEPTQETGATRQDYSPSKNEYTRGYLYQGYGKKYLSTLQNAFIAVGGRVMDNEKNLPLPKAEIWASRGETLLAKAKSDSQGFYNLSRLNLPPGAYEVKAAIPGYQQTGQKIRVTGDKTTLVHFKLKKAGHED